MCHPVPSKHKRFAVGEMAANLITEDIDGPFKSIELINITNTVPLPHQLRDKDESARVYPSLCHCLLICLAFLLGHRNRLVSVLFCLNLSHGQHHLDSISHHRDEHTHTHTNGHEVTAHVSWEYVHAKASHQVSCDHVDIAFACSLTLMPNNFVKER